MGRIQSLSVAVAALLLLVTGCEIQQPDGAAIAEKQNGPADYRLPERYSVSFENPVGRTNSDNPGEAITSGEETASGEGINSGEETKVYIGSDALAHWNENDKISVFSTTAQQVYGFQGKTGDLTGTFASLDDIYYPGDELTTGNVYAFYPASNAYTNQLSTNGSLSIRLGKTQYYCKDSYDPKANIMVAVATPQDTNLSFKNVMGYLVLKVYGYTTVKTVKLKGNYFEALYFDSIISSSLNTAPSISVSQGTGAYEISLDCGDGVTVGQTKENATSFWFVVPPVTFSKGFTVTIETKDGRTLTKSTNKTRTIERNKVAVMDFIEWEKPLEVTEGPLVDMGLSVKWASNNLGSSKSSPWSSAPESTGSYYAWGETSPKSSFGPSTYKFYENGQYTKYNASDKLVRLELEDDAANAILGENWRMPTAAEVQELLDECEWLYKPRNNVPGFYITSKHNGNVIFLPANTDYFYESGRGDLGISFYLTSSFDGTWAEVLRLFGNIDSPWLSTHNRTFGFNIRPVYGQDEIVSVTGVTLDKNSITIDEGDYVKLVATVLPTNATNKNKTWSSDNPSVVSVSDDGIIYGKTGGTANITVTTSDGAKTAVCKVTVNPFVLSAVDLGLPSGIKWAECNLEAYVASAFGGKFAWGETTSKLSFNNDSYKFWNGTVFTKYKDSADKLSLSDDAANAILGGNWRMPDNADWAELFNGCDVSFSKVGSVDCCVFTSKTNGKSIYLPCNLNNNTYYWSASHGPDGRDYVSNALKIFNNGTESIARMECYDRFYGAYIRAVLDKPDN